MLAESVLSYPDVAFDETSKRLFVSRGSTNEVLVFDVNGTLLGSITPDAPFVLNVPSSLAIKRGPGGNSLVILNTGSDVPQTGEPSIAVVSTTAKPKK
jgi:hypothetical protein